MKFTDNGYVSLAKESFTETKNGQKSKRVISEQQYPEILNEANIQVISKMIKSACLCK